MKPLSFAARSLRREFRHGELAMLAAALVLAVAALTAVGTLAARVERAILASAAELIGGDLGIASRQPLPDEFAAQARAFGLSTNAYAEFPSVLFAGDASQFAEIRATDAQFPLRGAFTVRDADGVEHAARAPARGEIYVDPRVRSALGQRVGGHLQLGGRDLRIAGEIARTPDGGAAFTFAPRALIALDDAREAGLLGSGSRAGHRLLLAGDAAAIDRYREWAQAHLPPTANLITLESAQQNLRSAFERAESFLRLAALLAALLAGVAVALAAQRFARRKTEDVALLRCLGASRREILLALLLELGLLALPACLVGIALGLGLQQAAMQLAGDLLPAAAGRLPAIPPGPGLAAMLIGLAVLFGFALPPLLRLREVAPMRVFRRDEGPRVRRFDALYLLPVAVAAVLIWIEAGDAKLAATLAAGLVGVAATAGLLGLGLLRLLRSGGRRLPGALRFGLANLVRRRGLSLVQAAALALSLTALNVLAVIAPSLLERWRADLPLDTPNYFLLNLQDDQRAALEARLHALGAGNLNLLPLAVGKLTAINGVAPRAEDYADRRAANWLEGEVRLSWSETLPPANRIESGQWFGEAPPTPEISLDQSWMRLFNLKLGDRLSLRVGEQEIEAVIASVRAVDWDSFRVNFFLMLDAPHAAALPHSLLASFHLPPGNAAALAALSREFPAVSLVDINAILDRVREVIAQVGTAAAWVLGFSLAAGVLVLLAALAATADERRFESALLRTLGASRGQLAAALLGEFAALGLLAGLIGGAGAGAIGIALGRTVFRLPDYLPPLLPLLGSTVAAALLVTVTGALGTRRIARTPPVSVLREAS